MTPRLQLERKVTYLVIALLLACFAIAQSARAITSEPEGGNPNENVTEEETADLDVSTDEANAAAEQRANEGHPNRRIFAFNFAKPRPACASGIVRMHSELVITFQVVPGHTIAIQPKWVAVKDFSGNVPIDRKLEVKSAAIQHIHRIEKTGQFAFEIEMIVTGPSETPRFRVSFDMRYKFQNGLVTEFTKDTTPNVRCVSSP
jgi:hypothetical protein